MASIATPCATDKENAQQQFERVGKALFAVPKAELDEKLNAPKPLRKVRTPKRKASKAKVKDS